MAVELTAGKLSESVKEGFERAKRFRLARASHIRAYVGDYFCREAGVTGDQPLNLVFLAIRSLVPNVIQKEGCSEVLTPVLAQREYAEKLGLALDELHRKIKQARLLRACVVDACVGGLTIAKTSIAASGQLFTVAPDIRVDPGQLYTERISLDDFTCDPCCTSFDRATFLGHRIRIERNKLLAADGFNKELVRSLPRAGTKKDDRAQDLSQDANQSGNMLDLQDYVNIVELWVPEAQAICYLPDPDEDGASDFLKVEEYYGPPSGYYSFGSLTQPVPDNPFPIAPVGVWRDLSDMASQLFKKAMMQADRQKNITLYRPSSADTAETIKDANDGDALATEDPDGVKVVSYEGPSQETVQMTSTIYGWFNLVAGNPDLMSGANISSDKATGQQILQQNASVSVGDMRDMMYEFADDIAGKQAWFLHNDDLMFVPGQPGIPLIKRDETGRERQLWLTPQDKSGEFDTLGFKIVRRSMTVPDPATRARMVSAFTTQIVPQAFQALMVAMQAGQPWNIQRYLTRIAEDWGIVEVVDGIFTDPEFQQKMMWYSQTVGKQNKKAGGTDTTQNGQFPVGGTPMGGPVQQFNQQSQAAAAEGQSAAMMGAM